MLKKNRASLFYMTIWFVTIFCTTILSAKEYTIPTGNETIECSIKTVSKSKLQKLLGDISISLDENYQVIKVKVTNNSQETIILNRDEYLDGLEDVIGLREDIISLYDQNLTKLKANRFLYNLGSYLFGFLTLNCILCSFLTQSNEVIIITIPTALFCLPFIIESRKANNNIKTITNKKNETLRSTCLHSNKTNKTKHYKETTNQYKVPKKHTFYDIIFIKREKSDQSFLNTNLPRLYYQTITQTN